MDTWKDCRFELRLANIQSNNWSYEHFVSFFLFYDNLLASCLSMYVYIFTLKSRYDKKEVQFYTILMLRHFYNNIDLFLF